MFSSAVVLQGGADVTVASVGGTEAPFCNSFKNKMIR